MAKLWWVKVYEDRPEKGTADIGEELSRAAVLAWCKKTMAEDSEARYMAVFEPENAWCADLRGDEFCIEDILLYDSQTREEATRRHFNMCWQWFTMSPEEREADMKAAEQ